jgi:hypothetical protein
LSLSAPYRVLAIASTQVLMRAPAADRIPEFDLLTAYSCRAPPAI